MEKQSHQHHEKADTDKIETELLQHLVSHESIEDTLQYSAQLNINHHDLDPILKSLNADEYVVLNVIEKKTMKLTDDGV